MQLQQDSYANYYNQPLQYNQMNNLSLRTRTQNIQPKAPFRELSLSADPMGQLPDDIQLQKLWQNFSQIQAMNPRPDAEAADLNEEINLKPKRNRALKTALVNRYGTKRYLENDEKRDDEKKKEEQKPESSGENGPDEHAVAETDPSGENGPDEHAVAETGPSEESGQNENAVTDEGGKSEEITNVDKDSVDGYIDRLLSRVRSIDDKIDHLLFHNHHDLAGVTAHYTPYGIQMLPSKKSADSVDQKLKMVDYMHNIGGGYNPMLHTMLPYYLGHDDNNKSGIKMNGYLGMGMGGARKMKVL